MSSFKSALKGIFLLSVLGTLLIAAFGFGFLIHKKPNSLPYKALAKASSVLSKFKSSDKGASTGEVSSIETILIGLDLTRVKVSDVRTDKDGRYVNSGGALAQSPELLFYIDSAGKLYALDSDKNLALTGIAAPDRNIDRYEFFKNSEEFLGVKFQATALKFNDIEFYNTLSGQGLFISYTEFDEKQACYRNAVKQLPLPGDFTKLDEFKELKFSPDDWQDVYRTDPCLPLLKNSVRAMYGQMAGGRILFEAPNTLYLANGDFQICKIAQEDASYGKVIKIDITTGAHTEFARGFRNPKGLVQDRSGNLYAVGHGPRGGDELNKVEEGSNYGWPFESYGTSYSKNEVSYAKSFGRHDEFRAPEWSWLPSAGTSSLAYIDGFDPAWDGDLLVGSLVGASLFRLRIQDGAVRYSEQIYFGERIRDLGVFDGEIVILDDFGTLTFAKAKALEDEEDAINRFIAENSSVDGTSLKQNLSNCQVCHSLLGNANSKAPALQNVYGAAIGSSSFPHYSSSLKQSDELWTEDNLKSFLSEPAAFASGTIMPNPGISSEKEISDIIAFLRHTSRRL